MPYPSTPRILFIDAYDSFTNNIVSFLETSLHVEVTIIKIDEQIHDFAGYLKGYAAVVAGPGPGNPTKASDVGLFTELWKLQDQDLLPVLGICLGFQSLVYAFGGSIKRLSKPRHGIVRSVESDETSVFRGIKSLETVQYHSLHASLDYGVYGKRYDSLRHYQKPSKLRPLAFDFGPDFQDSETSNFSYVAAETVLMAVEHISKPFYGIQFHAESICSSENARQVIVNWWDVALQWHKRRAQQADFTGLVPTSLYSNGVKAGTPSQPLKQNLAPVANSKFEATMIPPPASLTGANQEPHKPNGLPSPEASNGVSRSDGVKGSARLMVTMSVIESASLTVRSTCETLNTTNRQSIVLDSENHRRDEVGEFSIIGVVDADSLRLEYNVQRSQVRQICGKNIVNISLDGYGGNIYTFLKSFMAKHKAEGGHSRVPFWGGLIGYISYEACLETIDRTRAAPGDPSGDRPDMSFVFVERSVVIDHKSKLVYVQSIKSDDESWVTNTTLRLEGLESTSQMQGRQVVPPFKAAVTLPDEEIYKSQIRACQSSIRAGDSYELCLTTQATIKTSASLSSWPLYIHLRELNPSPFAAHLRIGRLTLLSSSPERFLRWSRPSKTYNRDKGSQDDNVSTCICQFRPIKGTVKKQPHPDRPVVTLEEATAILSTPKERAENLMIVDLIRHDLYGVVGSGRVSVPKLMIVEEYATVFQLVSVIEGSLFVEESSGDGHSINQESILDNDQHGLDSDISTSRSQSRKQCGKTGIDVLAASLPPGSMTGAPKLRSCQILQDLEKRERGIYSGVVGYMDVGGGGDFSVVIRSAVRWDKEASSDPIESSGDKEAVNGHKEDDRKGGDTWHISAGGAVTTLSTEDGEWEEMMAKMKSTLRLFEDGAT